VRAACDIAHLIIRVKRSQFRAGRRVWRLQYRDTSGEFSRPLGPADAGRVLVPVSVQLPRDFLHWGAGGDIFAPVRRQLQPFHT
jgi:hypothetical protein